MADLTTEAASSRPKKPAGYYSKQARAQRQAAVACRRAEVQAAIDAAARRRAEAQAAIDARTLPLRNWAKRQLDMHGPAPAPKAPARSKAKRDRRSASQRELERQQEVSKQAWARRHPEAAKAERQLRVGRHALQKRWKHKNEGTPETHEHHARRQEGALERLHRTGAIDALQLASADQIAAAAERIGADVLVRTASLETRVDRTRMGDGAFYERLGLVWMEMAYTRWREQLRGPAAPVLDMIVGLGDGVPKSFTIVAGRYGMGHRRAKRLLIEALDLWPRILGIVRKEVDEATLLAAHAGIL